MLSVSVLFFIKEVHPMINYPFVYVSKILFYTIGLNILLTVKLLFPFVFILLPLGIYKKTIVLAEIFKVLTVVFQNILKLTFL